MGKAERDFDMPRQDEKKCAKKKKNRRIEREENANGAEIHCAHFATEIGDKSTTIFPTSGRESAKSCRCLRRCKQFRPRVRRADAAAIRRMGTGAWRGSFY